MFYVISRQLGNRTEVPVYLIKAKTLQKSEECKGPISGQLNIIRVFSRGTE